MSRFRCYMKERGEPCIKVNATRPKDVECEKCLWNMTDRPEGSSTKSIDRLYEKYKKGK
ncbi:MAG: hypothetical protein ACTSUE_18560 [Promethearchaeota archaeon]